jgi:hypothetical protein
MPLWRKSPPRESALTLPDRIHRFTFFNHGAFGALPDT